MKVDIENGTTTTGLLFKKTFYSVKLKVELNEEEKAIIKERKLKDYVILELPEPASFEAKNNNWHNNLTYNSLISGEHYHDLLTPFDAKQYQEELVESLKQAKGFLLANASHDIGTTSIEI